MEPWYKIVTLREEVREGRSFNPDEFAIHLEQVVAQTAPDDYRIPSLFFSRTYFTRALREHASMVLRRLAGRTEGTAPVLTLITQFGGGKTHTLTALYHLAQSGQQASDFPGVPELLREAGLPSVPGAKVAVFVGNAWDPREGRETPWIDIARQLAGDKGVEELGPSAKDVPPGTETLSRVFAAANAPVLILCDEVLNFMNRHRSMAESFHAFIQNLTVAATGLSQGAVVMSLPRSKLEMTAWDLEWQEKITKLVRRVAKDLISNDEAEISEVLRRRLFEDLGSDRIRKNVAGVYADWCFERRAQLPPEWTAVDTAATESRSRDYLRGRFESCYPFHPATLSVFQRKWQALPQYHQTRGTLSMLAQWISSAFREGYTRARREPLITLGSAPLEVPDFRSAVLGQLGESRLVAAIDADIAGQFSHARALDVDTRGPLRDIHRRVATTILFESSGGQADKIAHLPELRFALGEPDIDTTSIDNAALALESRAFFIRRIGADGFHIRHTPKINKVVSDRRASLDESSEVKPAMRTLIQKEFDKGTSIPIEPFPRDNMTIRDTPKLVLVLLDPGTEWNGSGSLRHQLQEWTKQRGLTNRLYTGSLIWCVKKPGRELRDKVELWLAWKRVAREVEDGTLGRDFTDTDRAEIKASVKDAEAAARDEVWAAYRFVILADSQEQDGLKVIDLGAGHASAAETLCGRVITALKSQGLLNESIGAGYLDRNWPPAFRESGAWPLKSLRQSFLNGALTRLLDPDTVLRRKVVEFVEHGEFGLASLPEADGRYGRVWLGEPIGPEEVAFEDGVFLLTKLQAKALKAAQLQKEDPKLPEPTQLPQPPQLQGQQKIGSATETTQDGESTRKEVSSTTQLRIVGIIPPEVWNRLGTKILPRLRSGTDLQLHIDFGVSFDTDVARSVAVDLQQAIEDLSLDGQVQIQ